MIVICSLNPIKMGWQIIVTNRVTSLVKKDIRHLAATYYFLKYIKITTPESVFDSPASTTPAWLTCVSPRSRQNRHDLLRRKTELPDKTTATNIFEFAPDTESAYNDRTLVQYIKDGHRGCRGKDKGPYVSSSQLARLLASNGNNRMHLPSTTEPVLASGATHPSRRRVQDVLKTESQRPGRFVKP